MQPTSIVHTSTAPRAARLRGALVSGGIAVTITLAGASALIPGARAEPTGTGSQTAEASTGGVASATTGGEVNIGQIVTGENTGSSIVTGNVVGPAAFDGGVTDSPTDIDVTLTVGPQTVDASGGDEGTARASDDDSRRVDATRDGQDGEEEQDITVTNRISNSNSNSNENQNTAIAVQ